MIYNKVFPDNRTPKEWISLIIAPVPKIVQTFYKDDKLYGLVIILEHDNNTYIINSIAKDDQRYTFAMQRMIIDFTKKHDKVIVMSTLKDSCIARFTDRFIENGEQSCFAKGV